MATDTPTRFRKRMVAIKTSKRSERDGDYAHHRPWTKSPAFAANKRGVLVHRVRYVDTILWGGKENHVHVTYLCGNGCKIRIEDLDDVLIDDPPDGKLVCTFCENQASRRELPSADHLAGRHVHRGVLVARQVCCLKPGDSK